MQPTEFDYCGQCHYAPVPENCLPCLDCTHNSIVGGGEANSYDGPAPPYSPEQEATDAS
jgi:hypothetical protein